ncbi:MAG: CoA-binding protein, partial [Deltaproteobacteria bacterium CG_4_9_14_3_um_filter_44_9]
FFKLAREITREKPIIIMKAGATKGSAKAAKSHTASLSGSDKIYDAMFKQSGVIRVEDEVELFDVVTALLSLPLPRGNRVGILTEGGGI